MNAKTILSSAILSTALLHAGTVTSHDFGDFKLHVYHSNDVMDDASFIVEGKSELVALEPPLFKDGFAEFESIIAGLKKPVVATVIDYHEGALKGSALIVPEGMRSFLVGPVYGGMIAGFQKMWGEKMVAIPDVKNAKEIAFGKSEKIAGVEFAFDRGASSDFPAASLLIGKKVYLTHWAFAKSHPSALQISNLAAVDAEILSAEKALKSGAEIFVGGHGGDVTRESVEFRLGYLKKVKALAASSSDAKDLAQKIRKAYPEIPGDANVDGLAEALKK